MPGRMPCCDGRVCQPWGWWGDPRRHPDSCEKQAPFLRHCSLLNLWPVSPDLTPQDHLQNAPTCLCGSTSCLVPAARLLDDVTVEEGEMWLAQARIIHSRHVGNGGETGANNWTSCQQAVGIAFDILIVSRSARHVGSLAVIVPCTSASLFHSLLMFAWVLAKTDIRRNANWAWLLSLPFSCHGTWGLTNANNCSFFTTGCQVPHKARAERSPWTSRWWFKGPHMTSLVHKATLCHAAGIGNWLGFCRCFQCVYLSPFLHL